MNVELSLAPRVSIKKKKHRCCWKRYIRKSKTTLHYRKCQEIMQNEKNVKAYQACLGISLADFKSYLTSRTTCHGARDRLENPPGELCSNPNFPNTLTQREKLVIINSKKGRERERDGGQRFAHARRIYNSQTSPVTTIYADTQSRQRNE